MANRRLSLQQFPIEVLAKILQKAGKASAADYCNLRATCKIKKEASNSSEVLHSLCLSPMVKKPLNSIQHMAFLNKCLDHENIAAYFVQGIITYFEEGDVENEMAFLENAAIGDGEDELLEAAYLYGVLRFLHGDPLEGPFDEVALRYWREDEEDLVARVWKSLRKTLHGISLIKKPVYLQSLRSPECFMYKRCMKFYQMGRSVLHPH